MRITKHRTFLPLVFSFLILLIGCNSNAPRSFAGFTPDIQPLPQQLATYEPMSFPSDNPLTADKAALGRQLFFDTRLSGDGSNSCSSCHSCESAFTGGPANASASMDQAPHRISQTLWNIGYHKEFYWDGRSSSLENQALAEWTGWKMGANAVEVVGRLNALQGYKAQFQAIFGSDATPESVVKALASFERTLISGNTAWDRWKAGDNTAINQSTWRGWNIFQGIKCNNCHDGVLFTDLQYHNIGIGMDQKDPDVGRFRVTNNPTDTGAFKTPTLRDVARAGPYFHDGSAATLEEATDTMLAGGKQNTYLDKKNLQQHKLLPEQREDLLNFLKSLTMECTLSKPPLPEK